MVQHSTGSPAQRNFSTWPWLVESRSPPGARLSSQSVPYSERAQCTRSTIGLTSEPLMTCSKSQEGRSACVHTSSGQLATTAPTGLGTVSEGEGCTGGPSGSLSVQPKITDNSVPATITQLQQPRHCRHLIAPPGLASAQTFQDYRTRGSHR